MTASVEPRRAALTEIRQRLERIGGRNLRVSPHPEQAGKWQARCEVPYPQEPARVRVFDAEAGTDELQLLTAVVEAAEKWVAEQKR